MISAFRISHRFYQVLTLRYHDAALTSAVQARAGSPFCGVLDALGPPCLTANVGRGVCLAQSTVKGVSSA